MKEFLTTQYEIAERVDKKLVRTKNVQNDLNRSFNRPQASSHNNLTRSFSKNQSFTSEQYKQTSCEVCRGGHKLKLCEKFKKKMNVSDRNNFVRTKKLCTNCLSHAHTLKDCESKFNCVYCHKRHHSMLHITNFSSSPPNSANVKRATGLVATTNSENCQEAPCCSKALKSQSLHSENHSRVLLPTAVVSIEHRGELFKLRALIDQGSQRSFIASRAQNRLQLPTKLDNFEITGMGGRVVQNSNKICPITLFSQKADKRIQAEAIVLPQLTNMLPSYHINSKHWQKVSHLKLADPNCNTPAQIDLLLGSDLIPQIILQGIEKITKTLLAQNTIFGWA
ncbi:uncharacterized protein LOC125775426 [Bactrocera dorsalis]|uniref:Uncharacterized protein LOC125775426 n=1 Tax=Bactrocera dorsalis TaxID=27457 RepID=A0ABM3IYE4_BACDO|nr:uncharacterized protein LOC125775426 [Bactrocera dorsalis]